MFYTVMIRHPEAGWMATQPYGDIRSARHLQKDRKAEGDTTVIIKTDTIRGLAKAIQMCNRFYMKNPKKGVLNFTEAGITAARLETVS